MKIGFIAGAALAAAIAAPAAQADKLDDIIASGTLRCAVVLDFPPMGSRDANNEPVGFDVDYCNDLAEALGVEAEIVETPFPDRIPALVSGRGDVGDRIDLRHAGAGARPSASRSPISPSLNVVTDARRRGHRRLRGAGRPTRSARSPAPMRRSALEDDIEKWDKGGSFRPYQSQADVFLALSQGQIDATVVTSTVASAIVPGRQIRGPDHRPARRPTPGLRRPDRAAPGIRPAELPRPLREPAGPHRPLSRNSMRSGSAAMRPA